MSDCLILSPWGGVDMRFPWALAVPVSPVTCISFGCMVDPLAVGCGDKEKECDAKEVTLSHWTHPLAVILWVGSLWYPGSWGALNLGGGQCLSSQETV